MRNYPRDEHSIGEDKTLNHSTHAIETAHYLRQITISKRRQTFRTNDPKFKDQPVNVTQKFWKP